MQYSKWLVVAFALAVLGAAACKQRNAETGEATRGGDYPAVGQEPVVQTAPAEEVPAQRSSPPANFPISYGEIRPGEWAIIAGKFSDAAKAAAYSRELRRKRVNNYIYKQSESSYLVLIGHFPTESQARKRLQYLQEQGFKDLELYSVK